MNTTLPYNRLAAFSLGVMTTVLLLAPSAKAFCYSGTSQSFSEFMECQKQERREREQRQRLEELERKQRDLERLLYYRTY